MKRETFEAKVPACVDGLYAMASRQKYHQNIPIGVLYDLNNKSILYLNDHTDFTSLFLNSVKMATQILYGSTQKVMSLSQNDSQILYNSIPTDYHGYVTVAEGLLQTPKNIPVRFYYTLQNFVTKLVPFGEDVLMSSLIDWSGDMIVHGIRVNDLNLQWLYDNHGFADLILHVCLVSNL